MTEAEREGFQEKQRQAVAALVLAARKVKTDPELALSFAQGAVEYLRELATLNLDRN